MMFGALRFPQLYLLRRFLIGCVAICVVLLATSYFSSASSLASFRSLFAITYGRLPEIRNRTYPVLHHRFPNCSFGAIKSVGALDVDLVPHRWDSLEQRYIGSAQLAILNGLVNATTYTLWSPVDCQPQRKLALIIPFRDRDEHLRILLNHMHALLRHQQSMYTIFVVEQVGTSLFNRAALFNVGFNEAIRLDNYDCFIFHDVDLLPQDDRLPYTCQENPTHLSVAIDKFRYTLPYYTLFGGVVALSKTQFEKVRGFSNCFFGWGGEDDDMSYRVKYHGYRIFRHPNYISRYTMIKHGGDKSNLPNPIRNDLLKRSSKRFAHDGYPETKYTVISAGPAYGGLFYRLSVDINQNQTNPQFKQMC